MMGRAVPTIAIRVDASRAIGTGHVRRMLALADALALAGASVQFVIRDLGLDLGDMLAGYRLAMLPTPDPDDAPVLSGIAHGAWAGVDEATDAVQTVTALDVTPDWVVIDSYAFGAGWHRAVRAATGARILVIDDLADRALAADLIVDHNHATDPANKYRTVAPDTPALIGPRYALIGSVYADAPRLVVRDDVRSIGIFMGGVDAIGVTAVVLDALDGFTGRIEVATTSANPHLSALRARGVAMSIDQPDLAAFFARHDLQIGAGGGASWERCCIGAPTLALVVAENQRSVVPPLAALGVVATTGTALSNDAILIRAQVDALISSRQWRCDLSSQSKMLVDGLGTKRVVEAMGYQFV